MGTHIHRRLAAGVSVAALSLLPALAASAQDIASSGATVLETITVTGEKVSRDMKSTASSVSIKTSREIDREKTGNATVSEVIADVPNVVYSDTVSAPVIRGQDSQGPLTGQGSFWGGTVPRATINLDGHYLNYNEFYFGATSVWDLDSIEVFRGPQTTSQGANAIAGAIIVNTKDPTFTPEAAYQAEIGNYNSKRASIALSGPIVEDQLAARLAIDYSGRDTFIDYVNAGFRHSGTDQDFSALNARFKLLWEPTDIPGLTAKLTYSHTSSNRPSQEAASRPFNELEHITTTMPSWEQHTNTGILDIAYDFENGVKVFNQTQYSSSNVQRATGIVDGGNADIDQATVSNETRVAFGDENDTVSGVAGLYYARTQTDEALYLSGLSSFDDTKRNLGLFGEVSYRFAERWTLTTGLRYQNDRIERAGSSVFAPTPVDFDTTFSALLPKASLAYAVNDDWTVGALVSRGYNPGGVSLNLNARRWQPFEEETIWNYELFTRATLLDDRLTVNSNLFYMDFKNAQYTIPVVISPGVTQSYTINAEEAHAYGLEIGADYQLLDNLTLKGSAGILRTKIDRIASNVAYEGNEFAKAPGYMVTFGASWDVTEKLNLSGQVRHLDGYYSDTSNTAAYAIKPYTIADIRASYKLHDNMEAYGYVKNVFDERSPTYMQQNRGIGGIEASMTAPRMFGIGVKGTF
ncbi:TonB-dependent receptor domain-containing protein [Shinella sp.]|uniref:TonB-dependent receptor n=1 Tax=Shinella sp. TaxID=1870904 RepID=UPI0028A660BE|nr:TonB-dependent receptor [Shinella sp.]